jgi:carboxymethylenebutenolidase
MTQHLTLDTPHGPIGAWRVDPPFAPKGALVVVQEIFGVNAHLRGVVERFAAHGFNAMAPAVFDLVEPGVELAYDEAGVAKGRALAAAVGFDRAVACVDAAARALANEAGPAEARTAGLEARRVGVVGYCWGGTVALLSNARLGLPAVDYYGGRSVPFLGVEHPEAPLLCHFGERDPLIPPEHVALHREHLPQALIEVWPAGHGFNCEQRADYHEPSARDAMVRTVTFLERALR